MTLVTTCRRPGRLSALRRHRRLRLYHRRLRDDALTANNIVLVPIRSGLGLRLGANIGYLKYTPRATWETRSDAIRPELARGYGFTLTRIRLAFYPIPHGIVN